MKLIIDIPEEIVTAIQNGQDYRYDIHTAIAQGKPCDTSGDLISREALKNAITEATYNFEQIPIRVDKVQEIIDNAPTVAVNCKDCDGYEAGYSAGLKDAERPQGQWVKSDVPESVLAKCSICGFDCGAYTHNFCPKCGADMRKGGTE